MRREAIEAPRETSRAILAGSSESCKFTRRRGMKKLDLESAPHRHQPMLITGRAERFREFQFARC